MPFNFVIRMARFLSKSTRILKSKVFVSISNTGKISEQTKKQILTAQTHSQKQPKIRFGGIGISLDLIQKIMFHYGGRIWMENHPDHGTTFHLSLPIAE